MRVTSQIIFSVCFFCVVTFTYEVRPKGISIVPSFGINTENDTLAPINSSQFVVKREILGVSTFGLDLEAPVGKPLKIGISYMYMKALLLPITATGITTINRIYFNTFGLYGKYIFCSDCKLQPFIYVSTGFKVGYPERADLNSYVKSTSQYLDLNVGANYKIKERFLLLLQGGIGRTQARVGICYLLIKARDGKSENSLPND
jgi:hypothetical protein